MNTNPSKQKRSKAASAVSDEPQVGQGQSDVRADFTPSWWRDDVHGRLWEGARQSVSQSWKDVQGNQTLPQRMRTGETDASLNRDLDRVSSGVDVRTDHDLVKGYEVRTDSDIHTDSDIRTESGPQRSPDFNAKSPIDSSLRPTMKSASELESDRLARQDRDRSRSSREREARLDSDSSTDSDLDEAPLRYGVGARREFGKEYPAWNPQLSRKLRDEWSQRQGSIGPSWDDVEPQVRHGYQFDASQIGQGFRKA